MRAARHRRFLARRLTLIPALAVLGLSGVALGGCDLSGGDGGDTVATPPTTPTTTTTETGRAGPPAGGGEGTTQPAPTTTTTTTPGSGGTGAPQAPYDPEKDVEGHDIPPPPGSPAEQFEKECAENPEIC